jgi:hypothetical protein
LEVLLIEKRTVCGGGWAVGTGSNLEEWKGRIKGIFEQGEASAKAERQERR